MNELTKTDLFYLHDAIQRYYWECKEKGEDKDLLKRIMKISDIIYKEKRGKDNVK
jgi:hypothetical protein